MGECAEPLRRVKKVTIYSDGGCRGNPGIGAWGALLFYQGECRELSGGVASTTNNRMELTAVIETLKQLKEPCEVSVFTDSKYVCDGVNRWLVDWQRRNWKTSAGKAVKNQDLWRHLIDLTHPHKVSFYWVKGHAGSRHNERADALVNKAMDALQSLSPPRDEQPL